MGGLFDIKDPFVRELWSSIIPSAFVVFFCLTLVPIPTRLRPFLKIIAYPFRKAITLQEAEALEVSGVSKIGDSDGSMDGHDIPPLWRTLVLTWLGLVEALVWLASGSYQLVTEDSNIWSGVAQIMISVTWLYAAVRPVVWPTPTAMFDLFSLYIAHICAGVLQFGGLLFDHRVYGEPLPPRIVLLGHGCNLAVLLILLIITLNMPLDIPSSKVNKDEIGRTISPEDYCTLWQWISFHWVEPLINKGTYTTLNEDDVWKLSPTNRSRPLFFIFSERRNLKLLRRIWDANSLDLILDFVITLVSVLLHYAEPFFLQKILASISDSSPESRSKAYIYAFSAFLCYLLKGEADCIHLWFGRRAMVRIRSQLMAAIYDKSLKRKDFSGTIRKDSSQQTDDTTSNDPKSGADVGKIVNLMSSDTNIIAQVVSGAYFIYGAPFEIIIASIFLFNLLGWAAFSSVVVVMVFWPLNSLISKRAIRIQKGVLAARDKRMGILNELIGAVKFIKFFAWEDRWIARAMDARKFELDWLVKMRINSVLFSAVWTFAPILVSVISFLVFVYQGNQLTVSTAFTAISLFTMIRSPLNVLPAWIVYLLQAGVSVDRISVYLDEDEVDEQVSTMKKDYSDEAVDERRHGLGIMKGTFKWNEIESKSGNKEVGNGKSTPTSTISSDTAMETETQTTLTESENHRFELRDISVMFPEGRLSVITGPTASGKTALLMALLGEMSCLEGELVMTKNPFKVDENGYMHAISYAAQAPWLQHLSIKDNILFGSVMNEERYDQVIECCALKPDLEILEDGDMTEIGARGVSLSGGQKARVALARAVYARTKYVLLDDPLSAVDSHTSRFLFDKLLCGPLFANRTVILVTHHVELVLPGADYLVRMLDGRIDVQGNIQDLRAQGVLDTIAQTSSVEEQEAATSSAAADSETQAIEEETEQTKTDAGRSPRKLVKDEHRETGSVKWSIYNSYLKASSYWPWAIILILVIIQQLGGVGEKVWIKYWGSAYQDAPSVNTYTFSSFTTPEYRDAMNDPVIAYHLGNQYHQIQDVSVVTNLTLPDAEEHPMFYIGIYAAIGIGGGVVGLMTVSIQYFAALRASRKLFKRLLTTVIHATMRWFDTTPQGRLLNRFSKDIETVDSTLASSLQAVTSALAIFFSSVIVVTVVFPLFVIPAAAIGYLYQRLAVGYLNTGRDLRRMESNSRSPIFSDFGELLDGIVTVRAFGAEQRFLDNLHTKIDLATRMFYTFWMLNRHLLLHFDVLGGFAMLVTTLFSVSGLVSAGTAGVCITSAMSFTTSIYWACRFWTGLELDLNSVERVVEYLDLPQEPPAIIESNRVPAYWPSASDNDNLLVVEDLTVKYAPELPPVLHGVSFNLKAKERVGLLGRTGSGKSTLAQSILRFVDPISGRILIDGIDICQIGISDLRSRVTFIPQDATLFSGTLRDNLDPFREHEDAECLDVLYRVHMISESEYQSQKSSRQSSRAASIHEVETEDTGSTLASVITEPESRNKISLDSQVSAGGSNFSAGQRQLIAMARALLRRSAIIILDEATSSIDFATDAKIQVTIREEFNDSLLLTVAHRLRTVIDYDRLVILDKGKVVEFDTPYELIQKEDGVFRNMCLKSGMFGELESAAKAKAAGN